MTHWMQRLLWQSLAMAVPVLAYLAATVWLRRRYAAKWFYAAGVILLIGFIIPFRPVLSLEMSRVSGLPDEVLQAMGGHPLGVDAAWTQAAKPWSPWPMICLIWFAGALTTITLHGIRHIRFLRTARRWSTPVEDPALLAQFDHARQSLGLERRDIRLARCACIASPMLLWLGRPTVLLPEKSMGPGDMRLILLHELVHCKRHDLLCRLAMLLVLALHWFNPMAHLLMRSITLQCEVSCDDRVVQNQDIDSRHRYAMSILGLARRHTQGHTLLTTHFSGGKKAMKKRINTIYEPTKTRAGALLLACTLLLTLLAGTSIAADAQQDAIAYTLPDTPVQSGESLDAYVVAWEPIEGVQAYHLGVYFALKSSAMEYWATAEGWLGWMNITDDAGTEYFVENAVWESMQLPGDATEADIAALLNEHKNHFDDENSTLEQVRLSIVAIREEGEPIHTTIEIPVG